MTIHTEQELHALSGKPQEKQMSDKEQEKADAIAKAHADFAAAVAKAAEARDKVLESYPEDNIAADAWNAVKGADDLEFKACSPDTQAKLGYEADGVVKTGIANTVFELKVKEISDGLKKTEKAAAAAATAKADAVAKKEGK